MAAFGVWFAGVVQLGNTVRDMGNAYYKATREWKEFPLKVENLKLRSERWSGLATTYHADSFETLERSLQSLKNLFKEEERKLKEQEGSRKRQKLSLPWVSTTKKMMFPASIGMDIDNAVNAFDDMERTVKSMEDMTTSFQKMALRNDTGLGFERDELYVRLNAVEREVRKSLLGLGASNGKLVLLHGGTGRGKSSLARDLSLQIESPEPPVQNTQLSDPSSSHAAAQNVTSTTSGPVSNIDGVTQLHERFQKVVFLVCGRTKDLQQLQRELRDSLVRWTVEDATTRDLSTSIVAILRNLKLLVVLDDVWETELLQDILYLAEGAPDVKFLVTSQLQDLCVRLNRKYCHVPIPMGNANLADARNILARHIFCPDSEEIPTIPSIEHPEILQCADDIIKKVDYNLLAIACIGAARFNRRDFQDPNKWKKLQQDFMDWLNKAETKLVHNIGYPHSYSAAILLAFQYLNDYQKRLLFLTALCRGPSVPTDIIEYLYKRSNPHASRQPFDDSKRRLQGGQLLRIEGQRCSVHNIVKFFIWEFHHVVYERSFLEGLSESIKVSAIHKAENDILSAVCIFYLEDRKYAESIALNLKTCINAEDECTLKERSSFVEDVSLLAVKEVLGDWTEELQLHSRKVFLKFISERCINYQAAEFLQALESLLRQPLSRGHMARALVEVILYEYPHQRDRLPQQIQLLLLKTSTEEPITRTLAALVLLTLAVHGEKGVSKKICETERAVSNLVDAVSEKDVPHLQKWATLALYMLAQRGGHDCCEKILDVEKAIGALVDAIAVSQDEQVCDVAACTLTVLASCGGRHRCEKICRTPGSVSNLVNAMSKNDGSHQYSAILALAALAEHGREEFCKVASTIGGAIQALVDGFARTQITSLLDGSTSSSATLTSRADQDVYEHISEAPWPVSNSIDAMGCHLQISESAAQASFSTQSREHLWKNMLKELSNSEEALHSREITKTQKRKSRGLVADILAILATYGGQDLCKKICKTPGAVSILVSAMREKNDAEHAIALMHLGHEGKGDFCRKISQIRGAIQVLVNAAAGSQPVQVNAIFTLLILTFYGGQDLCKKICDTPGAISTLFAAMVQKDVLGLEVVASEVAASASAAGATLCTLATRLAIENGERDFCREILSIEGSRQALCDAFANQDQNQDVRECAGCILALLARNGGPDL